MWSKVGIGGEHHRYCKHNKFSQNPRGDPKFLVDLTRNDPMLIKKLTYITALVSKRFLLKWKKPGKDNQDDCIVAVMV